MAFANPLHEAAKQGNEEKLIATLLSYSELERQDFDAKINEVDFDGFTPLHYTISSAPRKLKIATILLECGADPNIQALKNSWSPLHYAVLLSHEKSEKLDLVKLLVDYGANPTLPSDPSSPIIIDNGEEIDKAMIHTPLSFENNPTILTKSKNNTVKTWNIEGVLRKEKTVSLSNRDYSNSDGNYILTPIYDTGKNETTLFSLEDDVEERVMLIGGKIKHATRNNKNNLILTLSADDNSIKLWSLKGAFLEGDCLAKFEHDADSLSTVAFDQSGNYLIATSSGKAYVWKSLSGSPLDIALSRQESETIVPLLRKAKEQQEMFFNTIRSETIAKIKEHSKHLHIPLLRDNYGHNPINIATNSNPKNVCYVLSFLFSATETHRNVQERNRAKLASQQKSLRQSNKPPERPRSSAPHLSPRSATLSTTSSTTSSSDPSDIDAADNAFSECEPEPETTKKLPLTRRKTISQVLKHVRSNPEIRPRKPSRTRKETRKPPKSSRTLPPVQIPKSSNQNLEALAVSPRGRLRKKTLPTSLMFVLEEKKPLRKQRSHSLSKAFSPRKLKRTKEPLHTHQEKVETEPEALNKIENILSSLILHHKKKKELDLANEKEIALHLLLITKIPRTIRSLTSLVSLTINKTTIEHLPESFESLVLLEELDVANNQLRSLPLSLSSCSKLKRLIADHNQLTQLPPEWKELRKLTTLNLSDNNLAEFPTVIMSLLSLENLLLRDNELTTLPDNIKKLKKLRTLDISNEGKNNDKEGNKLARLPSSLGEICTLEALMASNNKIDALPEDFGKKLKELEWLFLDGNKLKSLPQNLRQESNPKLGFFNLKGNDLDDREQTKIKENFPKLRISF